MKEVNNNNEIEAIAHALYKKSKRTFAYHKEDLRRQAEYFSPLYRNFILKLINNSSLKIVHEYKEGYLRPDYDKEIFNKNERIATIDDFRKRAVNRLVTDINDVETLPHELGHAVDFFFGYYATLTRNVAISDNKTLYEIFTEEFNSKKEELYALVMNEYKDIINSNINKDAYDILINNIDKYRELSSLDERSKDKKVINKRKALQEELYNVGFVETYFQLIVKKCFNILNSKYSPILDALSSSYDFNGLYLHYHSKEYYECDLLKGVEEFFANLFAVEVTSNMTRMSYLRKYLPKSVEGFEKLFELFYKHIQSNKRFTDLALKQEEALTVNE